VRSIEIGMFVCLSARISQKQHVQTSRNFLDSLSVVVAWFSSDDSTISYVLPVLWMTSCLSIIVQMQIQAWSLRRG